MLIQANNTQRMWIIYKHTLNERSLYIGMCRYSEYFAFPDAKLNSEWIKQVKTDTFITSEMIMMFQTREEALDAQRVAIIEYRPYCNIHGETIARHGKRIKCVDNGETFNNATTAAQAAGVSRQAMSQHLAGKIHTINGKRFARE